MWIDHANLDPGLELGNSDGFGEVRVVANHDRSLTTTTKCIEQQIGRQVHVGTFLLRLQDGDRRGARYVMAKMSVALVLFTRARLGAV